MSTEDKMALDRVSGQNIQVASERYYQAIQELIHTTLTAKEKFEKVVELGKKAGRSNDQIRADIFAAFNGKLHPKVISRYMPKELKSPRHVAAGKKGADVKSGNCKLPTSSEAHRDKTPGADAPIEADPKMKTAQMEKAQHDCTQSPAYKALEDRLLEEQEDKRQLSEAIKRGGMWKSAGADLHSSRKEMFVPSTFYARLSIAIRNHKDGFTAILQGNELVDVRGV